MKFKYGDFKVNAVGTLRHRISAKTVRKHINQQSVQESNIRATCPKYFSNIHHVNEMEGSVKIDANKGHFCY